MIGKTVSHYRILEKLGEGGMGIVYKAQDTKLDRYVALKFLPRELTREADAKQRFVHEAKAASTLQHNNICTIHEIDETEDGHVFISMDCYEGETLKQKIARGPLPVDQVMDIVCQMAEGLAKAHEGGMVHRDIKPANIMVTSDGVVKILDFGLAKLAGQTKVTRTGATVGTVAYMSPEQARGEVAEPRSDVFSLGAVFYEMLTGVQPFGGEHEAAVFYSIMNVEPKPLNTYRTDLPAAIQNIMDKALSKDPATRYGTASEFLKDLLDAKRGEEVAAIKRPRREFPAATLVKVSLGVVLAVALYLVYTQFISRPSEQAALDASNVIAVFPFSVQGGEDATHLGEGMVDLLSIKMADAGEMRTVDPAALLALVRQEGGGRLEPERLRDIAKRAGAGTYVTGSIVKTGDRLSLRASLFETSGATAAITQASAEGKADEFLELVDGLAADIVVGHQGRVVPLVQLARQTTNSFPALMAYLEGENLYRTGDYAKSVEACKRAVAADSTFALAYYRMTRAALSSVTASPLVKDAEEKAMRYRDRLPDKGRRLLEAFYASYHENDVIEAIRLLRGNLVTHPDDIESKALLAELLFMYGRTQGLWQDEAEEHFRQILSYDPEHLDAVSFMHWLTGIQERHSEAATWAERRLRIQKGDYAPVIRNTVTFAGSDTLRQKEALEEMAELDDESLQLAMHDVALLYGNLRGAERVCQIMTDPSRRRHCRVTGYLLLAHLALAAGRQREAWEHLNAAEAESVDPSEAILDRAYLSITPSMAFSQPQLEASRRELSKLNYDDAWRCIYRPYLGGILSARLGDYSAALRYAAELDSILSAKGQRPSERPTSQSLAERRQAWIGGHAHGVRAEVFWARGKASEALAEIQQTRPELHWRLGVGALIYSQAYQRFMRAMLLEQAGRLDEALRWYGSLGQFSGEGFVYRAHKHLKMAGIYERKGETEKAVEHYTRFLELWKDCDEELRPLVAEARARRDALMKRSRNAS